MPISPEAKASNRLIIEGLCTVSVCLWTDTVAFHTLVDGPAGRAFVEEEGGLVFVWLFLTFPFISPFRKVPPVILAICLFSCHTCLVCFQGKARQKKRGKEAVRRKGGRRREGCSCVVAILWVEYECKGKKTAFLTA